MKEREIQIKYNEFGHDELNAEDKKLVEIAIDAAKKAYAPYSHFRVGAAVLLDDGTVVSGSNQENAAYPSGLCAERVALFYANAKYPNKSVDCITIVVIDPEEKITSQLVSPCGSCRQVISETEMRYGKDIRLLLVSEKTIMEFKSIQDLLPLSFNQKDLLSH